MNNLLKNKYLLLILLVWSMLSCTVVISDRYDLNKDFDKVPPYIIEGLVTNGRGPHYVIIRRLTSLQVSPPDYVSNATVTISDNRGNTETLLYQGNGKYITSTLSGINDGRIYTMKAVVNGHEYTATSVMADSLLPFESIKVVPDKTEPGMYLVKLYTTLNIAKKEYYLFKFYRNDTLLNQPDDIYIADNSQLNGRIDGFEAPKKYKTGVKFKFDFYSITKEAYDFYISLQAQINNDGGVYSSPPANVKGNIPGVLGLFQAAYILSDSTVVQ